MAVKIKTLQDAMDQIIKDERVFDYIALCDFSKKTSGLDVIRVQSHQIAGHKFDQKNIVATVRLEQQSYQLNHYHTDKMLVADEVIYRWCPTQITDHVLVFASFSSPDQDLFRTVAHHCRDQLMDEVSNLATVKAA